MEMQNITYLSTKLDKIGFKNTSESMIPSKLRRMTPTGQTAFRDSVLTASKMILDLIEILEECKTAEIWNVVHIVFTDGEDERSSHTLDNVLEMMDQMNKGTYVNSLKTIIFDVGATSDNQEMLRTMAKWGGENVQYYSAHEVDLGRIFNYLTISLEGQRRHTEATSMSMLYPSLNQHQFALLLNMDASESMRGQKWGYVCQNVERLGGCLGGSDLVSAVVFNEAIRLLSAVGPDDQFFRVWVQQENLQNPETMHSVAKTSKQKSLKPSNRHINFQAEESRIPCSEYCGNKCCIM